MLYILFGILAFLIYAVVFLKFSTGTAMSFWVLSIIAVAIFTLVKEKLMKRKL